MPRCYIGLGSNMGEREYYLRQAVDSMARRGLKIVREGPVRQTAPLENTAQPEFLNQIVIVDTTLEPLPLLRLLLDIETGLGRVRDVPKGPRTIDCDILLYNNLVLDTPDLVLPHPAITTRPFVTEQLVELDADICDPRDGRMLKEVCRGFKTS